MGRREWLVGVALTLLLLILATCVGCRESPPVDTSLLTGEPCEPPCWQGLTPGVSTEEEVNEFLRTSELVDRITLFRSDITLGTGEVVGVRVQWWSKATTPRERRGIGNVVDIHGGVVQDIAVLLDCEVTAEDVLKRYGPPHRWNATWVSLDVLDVDVMLYYPNHGFTARLRLPSYGVWLGPEDEIREVRYLRAVRPEEFLDVGAEMGYFLPDELESLREWNGYGPVNP
jgi:hypothetical protein